MEAEQEVTTGLLFDPIRRWTGKQRDGDLTPPRAYYSLPFYDVSKQSFGEVVFPEEEKDSLGFQGICDSGDYPSRLIAGEPTQLFDVTYGWTASKDGRSKWRTLISIAPSKSNMAIKASR